jgi:hypothetical protein
VDRHCGLTQTRVLDNGARRFSRCRYLAIGRGCQLNSINQHGPSRCPSPIDSPRKAKALHYHHFPWMQCHRRKFVPSILRPDGPSHTGVVGAPSPPIANGTPGHHHTMPNDSGVNIAYPRCHHTANKTMSPFPQHACTAGQYSLIFDTLTEIPRGEDRRQTATKLKSLA